MSGAVSNFFQDPVGNLAKGAFSDTVAASKAITNIYTGGVFSKQLGEDHKKLSSQVGNIAGFGNDGGIATQLGIGGPPKSVPTIAVQDPAAVAAKNAQDRQIESRRLQVEQQTTAPGRGGTILTDNYNYRT